MALLCASTTLALPSSPQSEDVVVVDNKICYRVCFPEPTECPREWHSEKYGECYTCCRGDESLA
ncbi:hypothetical protein F5887DRAFT_888248 [Amanita rubescens]|nr:hypothetical protein F5887DRAFT_888248 [Amanita rubescens]